MSFGQTSDGQQILQELNTRHYHLQGLKFEIPYLKLSIIANDHFAAEERSAGDLGTSRPMGQQG